MDSTPVKRSANCNQAFANPHFKPLWEPDTTAGRNAIRYSLAHHAYQHRISNAGLCRFCTDELTRRVSEAARRLQAKGRFHDDKASMDLFWQDRDNGDALAAGETIVAANKKNGGKIAVVDHLAELSLEPARAGPSWWRERGVGFEGELGAVLRRLLRRAGRLGLAAAMAVALSTRRRGRPVWENIPFPPEDIWRNKGRFLTYFEEQSSGIQNEKSLWDYALSRGEVIAGDKVVPRPLPRGWQRRWASNSTVWYHDCRGQLISRDEHLKCLPDVPPAVQGSIIDEEEDLIEL
ncbi:hypothetical protein INS49_007340 [Diaporthe citri]|uniref:uncharacterized protein n=1 Tax=Diaporthe citri TaxID=83186 RepID=UPI001C7F6BF3|nr:uncharacterized protein INS49_007340 [Diaporthe citri]KAG6365729.1 hypothetical protein INS49_007340 [Diaporthe citri]